MQKIYIQSGVCRTGTYNIFCKISLLYNMCIPYSLITIIPHIYITYTKHMHICGYDGGGVPPRACLIIQHIMTGYLFMFIYSIVQCLYLQMNMRTNTYK